MDHMASYCTHCGKEITPSVKFCSSCGTLNPSYTFDSGSSSDDPTVASSSSDAPQQARPPTNYGSPLYGTPLQNPYSSPTPYDIPSPPPPPSRRRVQGLLLGAVVLTLILAGIAVYALFLQGPKNSPQVNAPTLTATTAQVSASAATATATFAQQDYVQATSGTPVLDDPLSDNSKGYNWSEYNSTQSSTTCRFTTRGYEVDIPTHIAEACYATSSPQFSNFAFEIQMTVTKGDCGALLFRVNTTTNDFYDFEVCQDGRYELDLHTGRANPAFKKLIPLQPSSAIHSGLDQNNVLAVVANGNTFNLYVNHQKINSLTDSTYSQGQIGVFGSSYFGDPTEVSFSHAKVWKLS